MSGTADTVVRVRVQFPVTFSIITTLLVIALTWTFYYHTNGGLKETLVFFAAVVTAGGQITASFYTARALAATLKINQENSVRASKTDIAEAAREVLVQRRAALAYGRRYNDPSMYHVRDAFRSIVSHEGSVDDLVRFAEEKATNVIHILNFLEEIAFAIREGVADERLLRNQFQVVVVQGWLRLVPWITKHRDARRSTEIWEDLEKLYDRWKHPLAPPN